VLFCEDAAVIARLGASAAAGCFTVAPPQDAADAGAGGGAGGRVHAGGSSSHGAFDARRFARRLRTGSLGRCLLYAPRIPSTQTFLQGAFAGVQDGLVCVADTQVSGHGAPAGGVAARCSFARCCLICMLMYGIGIAPRWYC
jgi:hypothetical protein